VEDFVAQKVTNLYREARLLPTPFGGGASPHAYWNANSNKAKAFSRYRPKVP